MPHLRIFLIAGASFGAIGVLFGAFGAHGLSGYLRSGSLHTWETAVTYQLTHAMALLAVGIWGRQCEVSAHSPRIPYAQVPLVIAGWSFLSGIVLFSGSLYSLALNGPLLLGPVTPLGGVAFVVGWLALTWMAVTDTELRR